MKFVQIGSKICATSTSIYIELNEKIEFICKLLHVVSVHLTVNGVMVPQLLITVINYFIYDLKDESYFLSFPVMLGYVQVHRQLD